MRRTFWPAFALVALLLTPAPTIAQVSSSERPINVVTRVLPPMVVERSDRLAGFSIELWNEIAARLRLKVTYQVAPDVRALLETFDPGRPSWAYRQCRLPPPEKLNLISRNP